jgi:hypothetical protein
VTAKTQQPLAENDQRTFWRPAIAIFCTALLAIAVLGFCGNSCGNDFDFHLLSWMEVVRSWQSGVWYPHWVRNANYDAGEPRLIFYPPASWLLGSLLGKVTSWALAPVLFVVVALLGCGWSMYSLARQWMPSRPATLAACLYVVNPYALFVIYERSAYGELLAGVWMPLIVLFALRKKSSLIPLALTVAAIWLTNAPAAVMASYLLALVCLGMLLAERTVWPALRSAGGVALGLALAAFYIVPAAYEQRWVQIERALVPEMRVTEGFLFQHTANSYHDQVLRTASWIFLIEIAVALIAAAVVFKKTHPPKAVIVLTCILPLILFLQVRPSTILWNHVPRLRFLQFPWRWTLVLSVLTCVLFGLAMQALRKWGATTNQASAKSWWRTALAIPVFAAMALVPARIFFQPCDEEDAVAAQVAAFRNDEGGVEGTDEYTPFHADNSEIQQDLPMVRVLQEPDDDIADASKTENPEWVPNPAGALDAKINVQDWNAEHQSIEILASTPGYAILRLMDYPGWRVTVNGRVIADRPRRDDGLMVVPVAVGTNEVDVRWVHTKDVLAGRGVSAAACLVLALVVGLERKRNL